MKAQKLFYTILIWALTTVVYCQKYNTDANIIGDVQCNGEHLPFITISIDGTTIGTYTDATGHFQLINLPEGNYILRASGVGYKPVTRQVSLVKDKTIEVKFQIEEDVLNLETIVVTSDRNQSNRAEAPLVVNSISPELFSVTQSVNIAEGLCFTPGLRIETKCQNCGFTQLRMNGMEGSYTQILMNSRPVFSGLAGIYGLELIPANMIERIEVVRGGGSALFGGNAIAGTVNIITKEPAHNALIAEGRTTITGAGKKSGNNPAFDKQVNLNVSLISDDKKSGGYLYATYRDRDAYDANNDGFSESVRMNNTTFGFNLFHKPGVKSKISLDGYRINEFRRGGNNFESLPHEADIAEQLDHIITGGNLSYDKFINGRYDKLTLYISAQDVSRKSYYGAFHDPNAYGHTKGFTSSAGGQYTVNSDHFIFAPATTLFGIDNTSDYLDDIKLGANGSSNTTINKQLINTTGGFIQHDWKTDKVNLSFGIRYDYYRINDLQDNSQSGILHNGVLVPRLGVLYKINPSLRLRVGYAGGYRAPQVFNEDLHVELINATRIQTINADDLEQENSQSLTSSLNYNFNLGNTINDLLIEGFYTTLKNPFASILYELDDQGNFAYLRMNADDGAYVAGVNIEYKLNVSSEFNVQTGFTIQDSRYLKPQAWGNQETSVAKNFMRSPGRYGFATLNWQPLKPLNISLAFNYTGPMYVPHFGLIPEDFQDEAEKQNVLNAIANGDIIEGEKLVRSKDFFVTDMLLTYDFCLTNEITLRVYGGVKNLFNQVQGDFDRGIYRDAAYVYGPGQFRSINVGIKFGNL